MEKFFGKREVFCCALSNAFEELPKPEDWTHREEGPSFSKFLLPDGSEHGEQRIFTKYLNEAYSARFGKKHGKSVVLSLVNGLTTEGNFVRGLPQGRFTISKGREVIADAFYEEGVLVSHELFEGEFCPLSCRYWQTMAEYPHKVLIKQEGKRSCVKFETESENVEEWFVSDENDESERKLVRCRGSKKVRNPLRVSDGFSLRTCHALLPKTKEIHTFCDKKLQKDGKVKRRQEWNCCVMSIE